jgi:hypothetical protein
MELIKVGAKRLTAARIQRVKQILDSKKMITSPPL